MEALKKANDELRRDRDHLLAQLECPVCLETCLPPIMMCCNGHNVCSICIKNLRECPTCRAPDKPNIKNIFAEQFITQYGGNCDNKKFGCKMFVKKREMWDHLLDCEYRYKCYNCDKYVGDLLDLRQHISTSYSASYSEGSEWRGTVSVDRKWTHRHISCYDGLFRYALFVDDEKLFIYVRYFGARKQAAKYECWFKFFSVDRKFKCSYLVPCHDTSMKFIPQDYVIVDVNIYHKLKWGDGAVRYKINIKESKDEKL